MKILTEQKNLGRTFQSNLPSVTADGITWREFVERNNPDLKTPPKPDLRFYPYSCHAQHKPGPPPSSSPHSRYSSTCSPSPEPPDPDVYAEEIGHALNLVELLMHPESVRRITPRKALYHPFLADPDEPEDDELFPHPFGEGLCAEWHLLDPVTDEPCVKVLGNDGGEEIQRLYAGEGIAIGKEPCEFHKDLRYSLMA